MTVAALPPPLRAVIPTAAKGYAMQLDRNSLDRLLRLNDDQLRGVLGKLLVEYGVDVSRVPLQQMDMKALRAQGDREETGAQGPGEGPRPSDQQERLDGGACISHTRALV